MIKQSLIKNNSHHKKIKFSSIDNCEISCHYNHTWCSSINKFVYTVIHYNKTFLYYPLA